MASTGKDAAFAPRGAAENRMRMPRPVLALAAAAVMAAPAAPIHAQAVEPGQEGRLAEILAPEPGKHVCFGRDYDAAHMAAHPGQQVRAIGFRLAYYMFEPDEFFPKGQRNYYFHLSTTLRDGNALSTAGECVPGEGGVIRCGVDDDGGGVMIRPAEGGALIVDLEATGRIRLEGERAGAVLGPGTDDGLFRLSQRPAAECPAYDDW